MSDTQRKILGRRRPQPLTSGLPLLPVRDIVVFPYMVVPLPVGREASVRAVESAFQADRQLVLVTQRQGTVEEPEPDDLYKVGTVASIMRLFKMPDGRLKLVVQGLHKVRIQAYMQLQPFWRVRYEPMEETPQPPATALELQALLQHTREQLEHLLAMGKLLPPDLLILADGVKTPGRLADVILANLGLGVEEAQALLEMPDPIRRLRRTGELLHKEREMMAMQRRIQSEVQEEMSKTQHEYFLREQLKAIHKELGELDVPTADLLALRERMEALQLPTAVTQECRRQLARLDRLHPEAAEASMMRSYIDWLLELPWTVTTTDHLDLHEARRVLDEDHYGLEQVKERILDYLGVCKLKEAVKGPILCFVGPPGVGKTSLGHSIARALGRKFVRLSLGGIHDEAEIRGHRRTYVGALPGRIVQSLHQAGSANPVFMLDEVDKLGIDFRGDPAAALLEVLDPEQNHTFSDHYLGLPFDVSRAMFIATANLADPIPSALRDRMELIPLAGYTADEKRSIARRYLLPRQLRDHGLEPHHLRLSDTTLHHIITAYTREAGVRNLERELATLCRKIARQVAEGEEQTLHVHAGNVHRLLGVRKYLPEVEQQRDEIGVATSLAWTEAGGVVLHAEATVMEGTGQLLLTGHLGEVMKESAQAALSYTRARARELGLAPTLFQERDVHIHVPAGAIPKDGPSAGITLAVALISALTATPVLHTVAMSGEITLRGQVLPVGGVKEKILAAKRVGIPCVVLPEGNRQEVADMPSRLRRGLRCVFARTMDEVLAVALAAPTRA